MPLPLTPPPQTLTPLTTTPLTLLLLSRCQSHWGAAETLVEKWGDAGADGDGVIPIFASLIWSFWWEIKVSIIIILLKPVDVQSTSLACHQKRLTLPLRQLLFPAYWNKRPSSRNIPNRWLLNTLGIGCVVGLLISWYIWNKVTLSDFYLYAIVYSIWCSRFVAFPRSGFSIFHWP